MELLSEPESGRGDGAPRKNDDPVSEALDSLRRIFHALRVSSRSSERDWGISAAQLFVIQTLGKHKVLSINRLATFTHTHQSSVSVVVAKLVEFGFVVKRSSEEDARSMEITLSAKGKRILQTASNSIQERLVLGMQKLSPAQQKELSASLRLVLKNAGLDAQPANMFFEEPEKPMTPRKKPRVIDQ